MAGEEETHYVGPPVRPYQLAMRAGLNGELTNHYAARLSPANLARLALIKPGQDWRDLPRDFLPAGMRRALRKDHTRRYRRMTWDGVPRAVITRFRDPKSGEYIHPDQDRTITIREAARLQGFPDRFVFHGDRSSQYDQVGNAVPVQLAEAIGTEVRRCLDGHLGQRLRAPFRRRPVAFLGVYGELVPGLPGLSGWMESRDTVRKGTELARGLHHQRRQQWARQDWLVCPYRALDEGSLGDIVRRLYGMPSLEPVLIRPVVTLGDDPGRSEILSSVGGDRRVFVYF